MFAKTSLSALIGAACVFAASSAAAAPWTLHGDVFALPDGGHTLTTASGFDDDAPLADGALNLSGNDPLLAGWDFESALGFAPGAFDLSALQQATEGSAMFSMFTVEAGQTLSFDWQLSTRDVGEGFGLDYAFIAIGDTLFNLGSAAQATHPGSGSFLAQTGWQRFSHTFTQGGTYRVLMGVVDVLDFSNTTALSVSAVSAVPEPEAVAMLLAGLGLVGAAVRRRRVGAKAVVAHAA